MLQRGAFAVVCRLVVSYRPRLQARAEGRRPSAQKCGRRLHRPEGQGSFASVLVVPYQYKFVVLPLSPHQSSQCPASSFVTVVLADWTGCTDHNAERALASGSGAEGRTTDQAYMSGEG